jgi:hypothetical protein
MTQFSECRALREEAPAISARVNSDKRRFRRTPTMAAAILNEILGLELGEEHILASPCPRLMIVDDYCSPTRIWPNGRNACSTRPWLSPGLNPTTT